jgi:pantoate--beta-alanine ligase
LKVLRSVVAIREALVGAPRPVALVPTMGALHEGHFELVRAALERCATTVASLFVNPTQFGAGEDLGRYPRDEARDLALFEHAGVDVVFAPAAAEMYPDGFATTVHVGGPLGEAFEGAARPGHLDGVATVVAKLLAIVAPDVAFFGQKDAQQLAVVRRLTSDLDLPVEIAAVPTVREPDGLAMSSRNAYLSARERAVAPDLYRALLSGAARAGDGVKEVIATTAMNLALPDPRLVSEDDHLAEMKGRHRPQPPRFTIDYVDVVDADTFERQHEPGPRSLLVAAARLGSTRLIDNVPLAPVGRGSSSSSDGGATTARPALDGPADRAAPPLIHSQRVPRDGDATG